MKAHGFAAALGFLLLVGAFGGFARPVAGQDFTGNFGGDLKIALQDFGGLDPTLASQADRRVLGLVYDSLGRIDPKSLEIVPWAMTGWTWDNDKNITVTLRDDLKWSDGTPYDADDVAYSLNQYTRGGTQRWQVSVVNPLTVRFDFTAINPATWNYRTNNRAASGLFFTEGLTALIALPPGSMEQKYSGPFAVRSYTPDPNPGNGIAEGALVLEPNVHHFAGRPNLDTVTYWWPYTLALNPDGTSRKDDAGCALMFRQVHFIGWTLLANDLTNTRDCVASNNGFPDGNSRSLLNPDPSRSVPFVLTAKNDGPDFLYFGFSFNSGSVFVGNPGSAGQKLRSALYLFVNKANYRDIEPNTAITQGLVNPVNAPWAPASCPPWTPCNTPFEANTVPAPAPVIRRTDTDPGLRALDGGGFFDRNGDGIRETPTGAPLSFRLLAPSFAFDPRKTTIAGDMEFLFRAAGIDTTVEQFDSQAALDAAIAGCTTSCMYIKRFTGATQLPDWYYSMPEILAVADPGVETHLRLGAATCWDVACRKLHVGHVSHLATEPADLLPVLNYFALEAFDFESFSGWVNTFGGINNFWSLTGLKNPSLGELAAGVTIFPETGLVPGGTTNVQVEVRDLLDQTVSDATVALTATSGTLGAVTVRANGLYNATYTAPSAVSAVTDVTVTAWVTREQYKGTTAWGVLSVHPPAPAALQVAVARPSGVTEVDSGANTVITVQVLNAAGDPVSDATVAVRTDLPGATLTPISGTTGADGKFTTTFSATVRQGMTYQIFAEASKADFASSGGETSLAVKSVPGAVTQIQVTKNVPGFEAPFAIGAIAVVFALVALARRRREG